MNYQSTLTAIDNALTALNRELDQPGADLVSIRAKLVTLEEELKKPDTLSPVHYNIEQIQQYLGTLEEGRVDQSANIMSSIEKIKQYFETYREIRQAMAVLRKDLDIEEREKNPQVRLSSKLDHLADRLENMGCIKEAYELDKIADKMK